MAEEVEDSARREKGESNWISLTALLLSACTFAAGGIYFLQSSEVQALPITQIIFIEDNRRQSSGVLLAPEVVLINKSRDFGDTVLSHQLTIVSDGKRIACFKGRGYASIQWDETRKSSSEDKKAPQPAQKSLFEGHESGWDIAEEIHHRWPEGASWPAGSVAVGMYQNTIQQAIPAGGVLGQRIVFNESACVKGSAASHQYSSFIDRLTGRDLEFFYVTETLMDGDQKTSCKSTVEAWRSDRAKARGYMAISCEPSNLDLDGPLYRALLKVRAFTDSWL